MPSELTSSVQNAIQNFVNMKTSDDHGYIAIDVLRAIRDEATLMMECQTICETFDSDPLHLYDGDDKNIIKSQVARLKKLMKVISSSRCVTKDYSSIETVVEISKDAMMNDDINESLRLTFSFERIQEQKNRNAQIKENEEDSCEHPNKRKRKRSSSVASGMYGTNLTYHIDLSKDHMKKERLIDIHVKAVGTHPSVQPAEPMDEPMMQEFDENGNLVEQEKQQEETESCTSDNDNSHDSPDQFMAYCDPEVLEHFLTWSGFNLDVQNALFFLMTFPYYEHEWDIFGFLLECVFGCDDESMEDVSTDEEVEQT